MKKKEKSIYTYKQKEIHTHVDRDRLLRIATILQKASSAISCFINNAFLPLPKCRRQKRKTKKKKGTKIVE